VPFVFNSDDFHFDTEIIIQAVASRWKIREVAIPTHYGDEKCHVNGLRYAWNCIKALTRFRLVHLGLFYERNFDFDLFEQDNYQFKRSPHSLHQYMLSRPEWRPGIASVELGGNRGLLSNEIAQKVDSHVVVDLSEPDLAGRSVKMALDLERPFRSLLPGAPYDVGVALDVIEHLNSPERFLEEVFAVLKPGARFYASTANIAYLPMRLSSSQESSTTASAGSSTAPTSGCSAYEASGNSSRSMDSAWTTYAGSRLPCRTWSPTAS